MGRTEKYETYVKPHLKEITEWRRDMDEGQIAEKLGVSWRVFIGYKKKYPELMDALKAGKQQLVTDLKNALIKKAKGYYYEETKTYIREEGGKKITTVEKQKRYAHPDTGAIHLLLKNYDDNWHNDDIETIKQKQKQLEISQQKADNFE